MASDSSRGLAGNSRGVALIYMMVSLTALAGFVSLGVDYGRVQLARAEAAHTAEAVARAAARSLGNGSAAARAAGISLAAKNSIDGRPVVLTNSDIEVGVWNPAQQTFTALPGNSYVTPNAVRVTVRRTAAAGSAIPLTFAPMVGMKTCDAAASAIATFHGEPSGFIGLNGVEFKNNTTVASYKSSQDDEPTAATAYSNGAVGSNGVIGDMHNGIVQGHFVLGPQGSVRGVSHTGSTYYRSTPIPTPTLPAWNPQPNPANVPQSYIAEGTVTLPGGTYWFTSLTVNGSLSFSGPATVHVNGSLIARGRITAYAAKPANLTIYQYGAHTFTDDNHNHFDVTAVVVAPHSHLIIKNNDRNDATFCGAGLFATITAKNNAKLFYDEDLGPALGGRVQLVR